MENQNIKKSNTRKIFTFLMYFIFGLYPIYGANKWGWTFNEVIALYWFEGIIIICDAFIRFLFIHEDYLYYDAETKKFRPMTFRGSLRYKFGKLILYLFFPFFQFCTEQ